MNKNGFFFTIITIAIISIYFISYEIYSYSSQSSIKTRIETMEGYLSSMETNMQRQIYAVGFRTIFEIENEIAASGNYTKDINYRFEEAFFNGTLYGETRGILIGVTYSDIVQEITQQASKINLKTSISQPSINVYQDDPWNVIVNFTFNLSVEDINKMASWNRIENIRVPINIEGFEDPMYVIETSGQVTNKISRTLYEGNYVTGSDVSNLTLHVLGLLYANSSNAPSFLDRLQGINSPSPQGIESLVSLPKLSAQGIPVLNKTVVDYIYFSADAPPSSHVTGMPAWFLIDENHIDRYQCTGLVY